MYLRLVDKLIKQGDYVAALDAVTKARQHDPQNRYAIAIEARVRTLIDQSEQAKRLGKPFPLPETAPRKHRAPSTTPEGMPSVEGQLSAIATSLPPPPAPVRKDDRTESKNLAILSKISSLLGTANECLGKHEYDRALEVVSRAALLDPANADIRAIEDRIRSAQEQTRRRELEDLQTRVAAQRMHREHLLRDELDRLQRDQEDRRRTEEAERQKAQRQKALQVIHRAREFLAGGQVQEAQCELAYLSVLEPDSPEVIALEREIAQRREDQHRAELEKYRLQLEEQRQREQAVRNEIERSVHEADALAAQGKFGEALRSVTRAYILDPTNGDLQACETRITSAQKAWMEKAERERRNQEEALRRKLEEEERKRKDEEREKHLHAEQERQEEQKREKAQKVLRHLRKAHECLAANQFKEAHEETATAFLIDPFSEDVALLERRIAEEQARATQQRTEPPPESPPEADEAIEAVIAKTLAEAKRLAVEQKFEQALQEVALAVALDPDNDMTRRIETSIKSESEDHTKREKAASQRKTEDSAARPARPPSSRPPSGKISATATAERQAEQAVENLIRQDLAASPEETETKIQSPHRWKRRSIAGAAILSILLLIAFYYLTPSNSDPRPQGPGTATQTEQPDQQLDQQ
jgi:hypothetical protein